MLQPVLEMKAYQLLSYIPMIIGHTVDFVFDINSERHAIKALVTDATSKTPRMI